MSIQDIRPNSQDTFAFYLKEMYQLQAGHINNGSPWISACHASSESVGVVPRGSRRPRKIRGREDEQKGKKGDLKQTGGERRRRVRSRDSVFSQTRGVGLLYTGGQEGSVPTHGPSKSYRAEGERYERKRGRAYGAMRF